MAAGLMCLFPQAAPGQVEAQVRIEGSTVDSTRVDLLLFDAEISWRGGDPRRAVFQLRRALELDPQRYEVRLELARILTAVAVDTRSEDSATAGREALSHWEAVLEQQPDLPEALEAKRELARRFAGSDPGLKGHRARSDYERGRRALEVERYSIAADAFRAVLQAEPDALGVYRLLGDALAGLEQWPAAESAYRKALLSNDQDAHAYYGLGKSLEGQNRDADAWDEYLTAFDIDPLSAEAAEAVERLLGDRKPEDFAVDRRVIVGRALLRREDTKRSITFLESSVEEYAPPIYRKYLGMAYYFDDKPAKAVDQLSVALQHRPEDLELIYYLGASYLASGDRARGRALLSEVLTRDPRNPNALKLLGVNLAEEPGREEDAERLLLAADRFGARIPELPCILGGLALRTGDEARADSLMRRCVEVRPDHGPTHLSLAILADKKGDYGRAVIHLERYLQIHPDQPGALMRTAMAYFRLGRDEEAFTMLRRITEIDEAFRPPAGVEPDEPYLLEMAVFFMSTVRNFDDATWLGERLLEINTENSIYNNNLAMNYADWDQKIDRAYTLAVRANELSPDDPGHLDTLGWVLVRLERYEEAESTLKLSIDLAEKAGMTNLGEIYYHLGVLYHETDREQDAEMWLKRANESQLPPGVRREVDALLRGPGASN